MDEQRRKIFMSLVEAMSGTIKLWQPDWSKQCYLPIDASKVDAGAMLY